MVPVVKKDHEDGVIQTMRDLEDFTRLWINVAGLHAGLTDGTFQLGLKWKNIDSALKPAVKIYQSTDPEGSDSYLKDEEAAVEQVTGDDKTTLGEVTAGEDALILPEEAWSGITGGNPKLCLLFEGSGEGRGELVVTLHDSEGTEIGEGPGVWVDLMNIKKMYVRAKGTPETDIDAPWDDDPSLDTGFVSDPNGHNFVQPPDEEKKVLIYVHGIHAPFVGENAAYLGNINVAETVFKRLWHSGYKGRLAFYKWPALNPAGFFLNGTGFEFNQSEYRGWKYGKGLAEFAASFPGDYQRHVFAHSQGNAVAAASFRDYSLAAETWVITQGAIPISCYDPNPSHYVFPYTTPDLAQDLGYRDYLGQHGPTKIVNFYNTQDHVTRSVWEANHKYFKPTMELVGITTVEYKYFAGSGEVKLRKFFNDVLLSERDVTDLHESMAMVVKSRSRSIGQGDSAISKVNVPVDLNAEFAFGDEHGSQWDRAIQQNVAFYFERLLDEIE